MIFLSWVYEHKRLDTIFFEYDLDIKKGMNKKKMKKNIIKTNFKHMIMTSRD